MSRHAARNWSLFGFTLVALFLVGFFQPYRAQEKSAADRLLEVFTVRPIGPANMGGRIVDLAVVESDPDTIYVAAATGGLWKTTDKGATWTPLMDRITNSLGAVAVAPSDPNVVWVGGGEANPRNSVTWGNGVYKSIDAGKSWQHMGLKETQHIGRVVIHPKNPQIVYVAALGGTWGPNKERGLFKTTDGGKTWRHVLALDPDTGCIDVAIDPGDPDILYAAAYAVRRDGFSGGNPARQFGPKAGLYKSADGGQSWERMTEGLPKEEFGRCGLAIYQKNPNVLYAVVQTAKTPATVQGQPANKQGPVDAGGIFRSDDKGKTWTHLNSLCPRPFYYGQIRIDPSDDQNIYVLGVAFHISRDGGKTFSSGGKGAHPDHHALWINPKDSNHLVLGNDGGLYFSNNKGVAWTAIRGMAIGQFYAIGLDMRKPYRVYGGLQDNGSWGGPTATDRAEGITLADWLRVGGGDGFYCQVDPTDPYTVYSESQYGNLRRLNLKQTAGGGKGGFGGKSIRPGAKAAKADAGKDDKGKDDKAKDDKAKDDKGKDDKGKDDKGKDEKGKEEKGKGQKGGGKGKGFADTSGYRFNWSSPLLISPHQPQTLYYGGNFLFKSTTRGDQWDIVSPDLTRAKPKQKSSGNTITTIAESPKKQGILYVGTDDGNVQMSRDDGKSWIDLSKKFPGVPKDRWITRVECSHFAEGTAYVTIDRHRNDDRKPYLFKTTDYGATWRSLTGNLPGDSPLHVIRESSRNPNLLFVGNENGVYVSLDGGRAWQRFGTGLPIVPIHDLVIHPRDRDLVIATHGRSIYVTDIGPLEELTEKVLAKGAHVFSVRPALASVPKAVEPSKSKDFIAPNPPVGAAIYYYLKDSTPGAVAVTIADNTGKKLVTLEGPGRAGINRVMWNLRSPMNGKEWIARGDYAMQMQAGGQSLSGTVRVETTE
ncbi:MAG: hypothetical protein L0Y72_02080 [Gemmataceae bacterium]|nr:hypothetical protein [Gemmataceae bacterium]